MIYINKAVGSFTIPPYFIGKQGISVDTEFVEDTDINIPFGSNAVVHSIMPLQIMGMNETQWFTFPIEPLVSVSVKNIITRRYVAKTASSGSVKEHWSQDDYEIQIQGILLMDEAEPDSLNKPLYELNRLVNARQSIKVQSEFLYHFNIRYMAIESVSFPHTKGANNQGFEIKGYSDDAFEGENWKLKSLFIAR